MSTPKQSLGFRRIVIDEFHGEDGNLEYTVRLLNERLGLVQSVKAQTLDEAMTQSREWFEWSSNVPPDVSSHLKKQQRLGG